jgi:hypothetical protein
MKTVVGLYDEFVQASRVVEALVDEGYSREDISLLTADPSGEYARQVAAQGVAVTDTTADSAVGGAVSGGLLGGAIGVVLGLGALAIPGIGPVIAAGPIVAGLTGAGIGVVTGGVLGALVDWGVPHEEATYYYEGVRRGGTLVVVKAADDHVDDIADLMDDYHPVDVQRRSAYWRAEGWTGTSETTEAYTADKFTDFDRQRERYAAYDEDAFYDYEPSYYTHYQTNYSTRNYPYTYYTPAYRYGYTLGTEDRYRDYSDWTTLEPIARRDWETQNDTVWDDIKEAVRHAWNEVKDEWNDATDEVDDMLDTGLYDKYEPAYRQHYTTNFGRYGRDYTYYAPAYRYGYTLANEYQDYDDWTRLEPVARRDWEAEHDTLWDDIKDAVRHGWNEVRKEWHQMKTGTAETW